MRIHQPGLFPMVLLLGVMILSGLDASAADVPDRPVIGLALGGGGANGLAHITMLEVFDELGVRPDYMAGTSIGAIMAALYASGQTAADIRSLVDEVIAQESDSWQDLFLDRQLFRWMEFLDPGLGEGGLIRGDKIIAFLTDAIAVDTFKQLEIPLQVIATDLKSRRQVVLDSGSLAKAVQASMAVPGVFTPVTLNGRMLVDGGLVNPVPFDVLFESCDLVVAINVIGVLEPISEPSFMDSTFMAVRIFQESILREKRERRAPDILIETDIKNIRLLHFHKFDAVDEQAQPAADRLRSALKKALNR